MPRRWTCRPARAALSGRALAERYDADTIATPNGITHRHDDPAPRCTRTWPFAAEHLGSTGGPKLVRLSHHNLDSNAAAVVQTLGLSPSDRTITPQPRLQLRPVGHQQPSAGGASLVVTDLSVTDDGFWHLARDRG